MVFGFLGAGFSAALFLNSSCWADATQQSLDSRMESGWSPCVDDLYSGQDSKGWQIYQGVVGRVERHDKEIKSTEKTVHFLLKTAERPIWVEVGPDWFWDHQPDTLKAGDQVVVHGYYAKWDEQEQIVAAEVDRGNAVLTLMNGDGTPIWCAWHYSSQAAEARVKP
jgi:hypothetical protein